ncbi:transposase [Streptomyces wuyuanensis]|uniref:transposase n=1 Tax=Streptomyces wuyuanensis TaxID=1196353 RepID=UPI003D708BFD
MTRERLEDLCREVLQLATHRYKFLRRHTSSTRHRTPRTRNTNTNLTKPYYHERWEVESAYFEIKKSMLGRRVLRSRTWPGIAQEIYALLTAYQVIRIAIADAAQASGADPDRCSSPSP